MQILRWLQQLPRWLVLASITLLVYFPSLGNQFVWDDEQFIYSNQSVANFAVDEIFSTSTTAGSGIASNYYRPLTTLSFAVDHAIWGFNSFGFHLTNTLLHIAAGLLLFRLLSSLRIPNSPAFWVSLLFLIHPLQTEAVTYANSRGDSLYTVWLLLGALLFAKSFTFMQRRFYPLGIEVTINRTQLLCASVVCFGVSVLSKEIGIAGIGILGLIALRMLTPAKKLNLSLRSIAPQLLTLSVSFGLLVVYLLLRFAKLSFTSEASYYEGTAYGNSLAIRLNTFLHAVWNYWRLLLFPFPLHMERSLTIPESVTLITLSTLILLGITLYYGIIQHIKKNDSTVLFALLWFIGLLIPVSGIVPVNGLLYEHWLYLPMVGFWLIFWKCIVALSQKLRLRSDRWRSVSHVLLVIVVCTFCFLTLRQNYIWGEPERFYRYTLQYANSARLRNNFGMTLADKGKFAEAIAEYNQALSLSAAYPQTHHNLGNTYKAMGDAKLAEQEYRAAITLDPSFVFSYNALLDLYIQHKQFEKAEQLLQELESKGYEVGGITALRKMVETLKNATGSATIYAKPETK